MTTATSGVLTAHSLPDAAVVEVSSPTFPRVSTDGGLDVGWTGALDDGAMATRRAVPHLILSLTALLGALLVATTPAAAGVSSPATLPESLPQDADYHPLSPVRIADTRGGLPVGADSVLDVVVTGLAGVPSSGVGAVVLNVTAVDATVGGYLTVFPSGSVRPVASNLNFGVGVAVPNTVIAKVGAGGKVSIYNFSGATDVIVDVQGWFSTAGADSGPVFTGTQYGWRFVPSHMLLAPGESRNGQLVQTGIDGAPTGGTLPAGVTYKMTGTQGNVTVTSLGGTAIKITAGPTIDTAVVAAQIPDTDLAPIMTVSVANLKPGVVMIDDDKIVFPDPTLPADFGAGDVVPAGMTAEGVAPFTWEQIQARISAPDESFNALDDAAVLATVVRYPLVLRGAPPAAGALVVGSGGSSVIGRVVEPVGLPTLVDGDASLISVELVGPQEIYDDLVYDLQYQDLVDIGAAAPVDAATPPAPDLPAGPSRKNHSRPVADPPATPDPNNPVAGPGTVTSGGGGVTKSRACNDAGLANPQAGIALAEFAPAISIEFIPTLNAYIQINDGTLRGARFEMGGSITATVAVKVKFQPTASFSLDCKLADLLSVEMAAPGPLAAFLDITGDTEMDFRLAATIAGGPKAEPGFSCSAKATVVIGFAYDAQSDNLTDLGTADMPKPTCNADPKPSVNDGSDGVGVSLEITIGTPLVAPLGVRLGGKVMQGVGRVLSYFNLTGSSLGKVEGFKAEVAPQLRFAIENSTNTMANENAKSAIIAEVVGKATVEIKPVTWLLGVLGIGRTGAGFSLTLYQETLPLANTYQALNAVDGGIVAKAGSDPLTISPAVFVQENDQLVLTSALGPGGGGWSTSFSIPELESARVFEKSDIGTLTESDLFTVSVIASTGAQAAYGNTTIKVAATISPALCDELRDAPRSFVMVGDAPMHLFGFTLPVPAWGGSFKLQCVEGKVEWDPTVVDPLDFDDGATVQVKSHGPKDDTWTISGAPSWMAVSPTTGPLTGGTEADEESADVGISTATAGSVDCWAPRSATLTVSTTHRGSADLSVTEEDPCSLEWQDATVTGPGAVVATLITKGRTGDAAFVGEAGFPDWLHLVEPSGVVSMPKNNGNEMSIPFSFTVDERSPKCTLQLPRHYDFVVHTSTRGDATLTITDPKVDARQDCGLRFTPNTLTDSGHSVMTLRDDDLADDETANWEIDDATVPAWLDVAPMSGTIESDVQLQVNFAQLGTPFDQCVGRPQRTATVMANAYVPTGVLSTKKVTGQIVITRPAIAAVDCPVTTGGASGDPHMHSLDGVPFEGQILGEYIYTRTVAGTADPLELVVRTQPTNWSTLSVAPTSVRAVALTYGGATVEAYAGAGPIELLVDGELATLADDVSLPVGEGFSVTRSGNSVRFDTPAVTVRISTFAFTTNFLDLQISAKVGSPLEGLLGSPDGNQSNDFVGSDGTVYTPVQIQTAEQPAFSDFVLSWRITDEAQSPFSRSYPEFGIHNPILGPDPAILAEFGDDVDAAMLGSDQICDGTITAQQRYGLALEVSIGSAAEIDRYICSYAVGGVASADGAPVAGLRVTLDGVGVRPCTTTSGIDGRYLCLMTIDLDEVRAATGPVMPLDVSVTGRWPGLGSVAASGSTMFADKASFNHGPPYALVALEVDPDSLPRIEVKGSMHRDGLAIVGSTGVGAQAYDVTGARLLAWNESFETGSDGSYSFTRLLPPTATRVVLVTSVANPVQESFDLSVSGLHLGANPIEFDVDYTVPTATISGTLTNATAGLGGSYYFTVKPRNAVGTSLPYQSFSAVPDPATGFYTATISLPRASATVSASVGVGSFGETFESAVVPLVDGAASVGLSGVYAPPSVTFAGDFLTETGGPVGVTALAQIFFYNAAGGYVGGGGGYVPANLSDLTYATSAVAPLTATKAQLTVHVGAQGETFVSPMITLLASQPTIVDFDVQLAPVRLHVSGTLTDAVGVPLEGTFPIDVRFLDNDGIQRSYSGVIVTPDPVTGAYELDVVGHRNATSATVTVLLGAANNNESRTGTVDALLRGDNEFVFNVGFSPPVVTFRGRVTGAGGAPLGATVQMYVSAHDDHYLSVYGQSRTVPLDAEGDYSFTIVMPSTAVTVELEIRTGAAIDWFRTGDVPIEVGANTVTLDADYRPPTATIFGTLVSAPGVPLAPPFVPGAISVGVTGYNSNGDTTIYTQPAITPGAGGAYTFNVTLPRSTTSIEVRAFISGEDFAQTFTGFAPGVHQDIPFSVAYNPPRLNLSGVAKKDGSFATGQVRASIRRYSSPTTWTDWNVYMNIGANGVYGNSNLLLPVGTIKTDITVQLNGSPTNFPAVADNLVPGELRPVVVDFDDQQTTVTFGGTLQLLGAPAVATSLYISVFDENGASLPFTGPSQNVVPGAGGAFGPVTFVVPNETARAVVHGYLQAPGWENGFSAEHEILGVTEFDDTYSEWNADAKGLHITGSLTSAGERVVLDNDDDHIQFNVAYHVPGSEVSTGRAAEYQGDNTFAFDMFVPLDATSVDLAITNAGASNESTTIDPLDDAVTNYEWTVDGVTPTDTTFIVYGNLTDGGVPITSEPEMTFEVIGYEYVDWNTPYAEVWRREFTGTPMDTGYYGYGWSDVPPEVTMFRVSIRINGDDAGWSRGFDGIVVGDVNQRQFDIDQGASRLRYRGNTILDQCTAPLVFYREFWSFAAEPTEAYDWDTHTWPGGVLVDTVLVIPNLTAPYAQDTAVHLPSEGAWLGTVYYDHNSGGTGSGAFGPNAFGESNADETISCG